MNTVRQIERLNKLELEKAVPPESSWHTDYRDTAYIYIGGLNFDLSEGDIVTIFSQFGEPVWLKLARDKETGKSRGFAFLKYEDQRSTDLAVDNFNGVTVLGRVLRVDHTRYEKRDGDDEGDNTYGNPADSGKEDQGSRDPWKKRRIQDSETESEEEQRPLLKEERELAEIIRSHDDDDPMKQYLIDQKREEVEEALKVWRAQERPHKDKHHRHRHRRDSRGRRDEKSRRKRERGNHPDSESDEERRRRNRRHRDQERERHRRRETSRPRS